MEIPNEESYEKSTDEIGRRSSAFLPDREQQQSFDLICQCGEDKQCARL